MNADNLKPCCYCLFAKGCTARAQFLAQVKALKNSNVKARVSSMGLTCRKYFTQYQPGDRVTFEYVECWKPGGGGPYEPVMEWVDGTAIRWENRKLVIFLDKEIAIESRGRERDVQVIKMYPIKDGSLQDITRTEGKKTKEEIREAIIAMRKYQSEKYEVKNEK